MTLHVGPVRALRRTHRSLISIGKVQLPRVVVFRFQNAISMPMSAVRYLWLYGCYSLGYGERPPIELICVLWLLVCKVQSPMRQDVVCALYLCQSIEVDVYVSRWRDAESFESIADSVNGAKYYLCHCVQNGAPPESRHSMSMRVYFL